MQREERVTVQGPRKETTTRRNVTQGGYPPVPQHFQTKVTIVGENEIRNWENVVGPSLVNNFSGPRPPLLPLRTPLVTHAVRNFSGFGPPATHKRTGGAL